MSGAGEPNQGPIDDGRLIRPVGSWTSDKLAILREYLPAFCLACSKKAGQWNFADGFAGPGYNRMRETGKLVYGSPLLALTAEPSFNKCLFVDLDTKAVEALRYRTQQHGERSIVRQGDVNERFVPLMREHLDRRKPCLALLDPEGPDLAWKTIEAVSQFREGRYKTELLILFPTYMGFVRMLRRASPEAIAPEKLDRMFGGGEWREIWERKKNFLLTAEQAVQKYVELYERKLRGLGYRWTMNRLIRSRGKIGRRQYHLIFATDNVAGWKIMDHCFKTCFEAKNESLLDFLREDE